MPETTKTNYKKTLNLPKTAFPMRAGLIQSEPKSLARWERSPTRCTLRLAVPVVGPGR